MNIVVRGNAQYKLPASWFAHMLAAIQEPTYTSATVLCTLSSFLPDKPLPLPPQDLCTCPFTQPRILVPDLNQPISPLHADMSSNVTILEGPFFKYLTEIVPTPKAHPLIGPLSGFFFIAVNTTCYFLVSY